MKHESQVRLYIQKLRARLNEPREMGVREKAACEAVVESLRWVVNKEGHDPESNVMDAFIDDAWESGAIEEMTWEAQK